jgi:hypothetical protein
VLLVTLLLRSGSAVRGQFADGLQQLLARQRRRDACNNPINEHKTDPE